MRENLRVLSDEEVMRSLEELVRRERADSVRILKRLAELERRRAVDRRGYPSLFAYCTRVLKFSEGGAMRRIQAARAASRHPVIYRLIARGDLTTTAVAYLEPHLTRRTYRDLLRRAAGRPTKEVKALVESLEPSAPPRDKVRVLGSPAVESPAAVVPASAAGAPREGELFVPTAPGAASHLEPDSPRRVEFTFAADAGLLAKVERAKDLLRHKYPFARFEDVFAEALEALLGRLEPGRRPGKALPAKPTRPGARRIPKRVRDAVWRRDGGACSFVGPAGRCGARAFLEFDHVVPWALGGRSDDPENVRLLCRAHNQAEARRAFGIIPASLG